jgi:hypothetical protein
MTAPSASNPTMPGAWGGPSVTTTETTTPAGVPEARHEGSLGAQGERP